MTLDSTKREIAARIRGVCQAFPEDEFEALVQHMAEIDIRCRLRDAWSLYTDAVTRTSTIDRITRCCAVLPTPVE